MTRIIGNAAARLAFAEAAAGGALHHAWLLAGPRGVGKASFAQGAAAELIGGGAQRDALIAARAHPDLKLVEREVWEKPGVLKPHDERGEADVVARGIRIDQVRWLKESLTVRPTTGPRRAVVIDAADDLERPAANALLKALEEPPEGTVFLLVSHAPGGLLPTVRSRCRLLRFGSLADDEVAGVVRDARPGLGEDEVAALVRAGEGSPGRSLGYAGLEIGALDAAIAAIASTGDPDNARRAALGRALGVKGASVRYAAFLDRAPAHLASTARRLTGSPLVAALDAHARARDLAGAALGLSLDPQATVWEMSRLLASVRGSAGAP